MATLWWQDAHKGGKERWEAAIGEEGCPYCGHAQALHETALNPGTLDVVVQCRSCGQRGVETKECITIPGPAKRAHLT